MVLHWSVPATWNRPRNVCFSILALMPATSLAQTPTQAEAPTSPRQETSASEREGTEPLPDEEAPGIENMGDEGVDATLGMSLEDLLDMTVTAASKKEESVFEAPLSVSVVTRQAIERAGARTLAEALRLAPGLIVREQSTGNYDVHIRGFDAVPPNLYVHTFLSTTMLVMIDGRVVYNHFFGGTFWETLPVDLHDVERIEIVRGPAAALYGPNGVTGVVNIITRKLAEEGLSVIASTRHGLTATERSVSGSVGYRYGDFGVTLSGNYQHADRHRVQYYSMVTGSWYTDPAMLTRPVSGNTIGTPELKFPEPKLALRRVAGNLFVDFQPNEDIQFALNSGVQTSRAQKTLVDDQTAPMSTNDSLTGYVDLLAKLYGITGQFSFLAGHQDIPTGRAGPTPGNYHGFDLHIFNGALEYEFEPFEDLSLLASASVQHAGYKAPTIAHYDDQGELEIVSKAIPNIAAGLRADYEFWEVLRAIAAVRLDLYLNRKEEFQYDFNGSITDPTVRLPRPHTKQGQMLYPSLQLVLTYRPHQDVLLRGGYHRAQRSPFVTYSFYFKDIIPPLIFRGSQATDLLTVDSGELGVRARLAEPLNVDLEVFCAWAAGFGDLQIKHAALGRGLILFQYDEIPTRARQIGATFSLELALQRLRGRLFATIQETRIFDHPHKLMDVYGFDLDPNDPANHVDNVRHATTPELYGGLVLNYELIDGLHLNANLYCFTQHQYTRGVNAVGMPPNYTYEPRVFSVAAKLIVNLNVTYAVTSEVDVYLTGRNLLDARSREFAWADRIPAVVLAGLRLEL